MKTIAGILIAIAAAVTVHAGNLTEVAAFNDFLVPETHQYEYRTYTNNTGAPIYIYKLHLYIFPGGCMPQFVSAGGGIGGDVARASDGSKLSYWAWNVDAGTIGAGPHGPDILEDYAPNYFELDAGDSLQIRCFSHGFSGYPSNLSGWIWYTTAP